VVLAALYALNARDEASRAGVYLLDRLCQIQIPEFVGWMPMADKNLLSIALDDNVVGVEESGTSMVTMCSDREQGMLELGEQVCG
jgi:hypothetical protein